MMTVHTETKVKVNENLRCELVANNEMFTLNTPALERLHPIGEREGGEGRRRERKRGEKEEGGKVDVTHIITMVPRYHRNVRVVTIGIVIINLSLLEVVCRGKDSQNDERDKAHTTESQ